MTNATTPKPELRYTRALFVDMLDTKRWESYELLEHYARSNAHYLEPRPEIHDLANITREVWYRQHPPADEQPAAAPRVDAPQQDIKPLLPVDAGGLQTALELARWALRWNVRARAVEARSPGRDWSRCEGLTFSQLWVACSRVAVMRRGSQDEPWWVSSITKAKTLLEVVAAEAWMFTDGEGSRVYESVRAWAATYAGGPRQLTEVLKAAGCLQKYEGPARAPNSVFTDAAAALTDSKWMRQSVRGHSGPRWVWTPPDAKQQRIPLIAAVK